MEASLLAAIHMKWRMHHSQDFAASPTTCLPGRTYGSGESESF